MNLNEFQEENNIVDPNLRRRNTGSQGISRMTEPKQPNQKRIVTPQQMGFTHEEPEKIVRPEDPILDRMDIAIKRKQNEARLMAQAIDEADGEGVTEEEFQDLLAQNSDDFDAIPTESEVSNDTLPNKSQITSSLPKENPAVNLIDALDAELEEDEDDYEESMEDEEEYDEEEYVEEPKLQPKKNTVAQDLSYVKQPEQDKEESTPNTVDNTFADFESGDINFDEENEGLEENIDEAKLAEKEQKEMMDKLGSLVREKIRPVSKAFDISSFTISKRPASNIISTPRDNGQKIADWVLMSSQKPIYMKRFSGTEIERLANGGKGRTRLNRALDTWQLIYNHIVDPHKPDSLEQWARGTSFLDIDHIYMAIYRANFEGSNYIPYYCTNKNCKDKVFLSDNFDIMDMCKFTNKEDKDKFYEILGSETSPASKLYNTEIVPVSEDYAFSFREPSIYNIIFESAVLDEDFVEKFGDLISMCTYVDQIYYINRATNELQPVRVNTYQNNMKKSVKSRIINYSKIISTLNSDQYNTILAYMQKINESGESLTYQLPEVTCPCCKTVIESKPQDAQSLVFTRHQLAALATS